MQKEKNKMLTKVKKLERDIESDEKQIDTLNEELSKEEIYTNYEKVQEIQNEINVLNENIKNNMEYQKKTKYFKRRNRKIRS